MTEKKNIDRLFQEKFKDFEAIPNEKVWDNIEEELREKKKRRVIPLWFRLSGIAAALILGIFITYSVFNDRNANDNNSVVDGDQSPSFANDTVKNSIPGNYQNSNKPVKIVTSPSENAGDIINNSSAVSEISIPQNQDEPVNVDNKIKNSQRKKSGDGTDLVNNKRKATSDKSVRSPNPKVRNAIQNQNTGIATKENIRNGSDDNIKTANQESTDKLQNSDRLVNGDQEREDKLQNKINSQDAITNTAGLDENDARQNNNVENKTIAGNPASSIAGVNTADDKDKLTTPSEIKGDVVNNKDTTAVATVVPNALEELLKEKEETITVTEPKLNRWQITSNVAPIYFSSTSEGSPLDSRFENSEKSYKTSLSYGLGVEYALNKKVSVRAGVNSVALEYNTTDLVFFQSPAARQIENLDTNIQGSLIQIDSDPGITEIALSGRANSKYDGTLNQKIGYVEVPVELSYKILNRKFGIEVIGGVSTLFLTQNEVALQSSGLEMGIGEANNLNDVHFSTNLGLGLKYDFLKNLQINVEPIVKYQLNTFSNDAGNFKPIFFGIYTGLNYRF